MVRRIKRKFAAWRNEPEDVRLRIATWLTGASGIALIALWLFVLLPLQLMLTRPSEPDAVAEQLQAVIEDAPTGDVAGVTDVPTPTPNDEWLNQND